MKNKYKISGKKQANRMNVMIGILISMILLIFSMSVSAAPEISEIGSNSPVEAGDDVTITWTTDIEATAYVYVEGALKEFKNNTGETSHSFSINTAGMSVNTYNYEVKSCTFSNNTENESDCSTETSTFEVQDTTAPEFTAGPDNSPSPPDTSDDIIITWETNENATSVIHYQSNSGAWTTKENSSPQYSTTHSVNIGAHAKGDFKYWAESCDEANNCKNSENKTITVKFYNVSISSNPINGSGDSGETISFVITVANTGNVKESFDVNVTSNTCSDVNPMNKQELNVLTTSPRTFLLEITLSTALSCEVEITVASHTDPSVSDSITIDLEINPIRSVNISAETTDTKTGGLGENVTYSLIVKNTGGFDDKYDISASTEPSIPTTFEPANIDCNWADGCDPGDQEPLTVTVTIPTTNVAAGTTYTTNVTATSQENESVKDSINLTTIVSAEYNLNLSCRSPSNCYNSGGGDDDVIYKLWVHNLGNINDTYDLTATADGGVTVDMPDKVNVSAYDKEEISLTAHIPPGSTVGSVFNITVTADSQGTPSLSKTINLTLNTTGSKKGIVTGFTAPANSSLNDEIALSITFKNIGSSDLNATPEVMFGDNLFTIQGTSQNVTPNQEYTFNWQWNVSNSKLIPGNCYWITPQAEYGGQQKAKNVSLRSEFCILKPVEINITPLQVSKVISPNVVEEVVISISNTGDVGTISNIHFIEENFDINLNISDTSSLNFNLGPGETRDIAINVSSDTIGSYTGTLKVYYTLEGYSQTSQSVEFNIDVVSRPILILEPPEINYINATGTTSSQLTATIINTGDQGAYNLNVEAIELGDISMEFNHPINLDPIGGTNTGTLFYTINIPDTVGGGAYIGQLKIKYTNYTGTEYTSNFSIEIKVTKNVTSMLVSPTSISISELGDSTPEDKYITIENDGNQELENIQITSNISGVDIEFSYEGSPYSDTLDINSISIGGTEQVIARISIPSSADSYSGYIEIYASDQNLTEKIPVTVNVVASICGNGILEEGEQCGEPGATCESGYECINCKCEEETGDGSSRRTHCLKLEDIDDYAAKIGDTVKIKVEIENCGRRDETDIDLFIDNCPDDWDCEIVKDIEIKRNKDTTEYLKITIPDDAVKKTYKLTAEVDNKAGDTESFKLVVGAQCSKDSDCKSGEYCKNGVCVPKGEIGDSCRKSDGSECESGICSGGVCIECESDKDCDSDEYCSLGECLNKKAAGNSCSEDYECITGSCVGGKCIECESSDDCDSDEYCDDGICKNLKVLGDSCESNEECETGRCEDGECACVSSSDCASDEYCENGKCKKKITEKLLFNITITPENVTLGDTIIIKATSDGNPVRSAFVSISIGNKTYPKLTDENGTVSFMVNETGTLNIIVSKSGYTEFPTEIFVEEKKEPGFWNLWDVFKFLMIFVILLLILILILIFRKRKKDDEDEKSLQTLRGFREKFDYTSHEIKEKIKEMIPSKVEKESESKEETVKKVKKVKKQEVVKEAVKEAVKEEIKEKPERKIAGEEPELLSIEDIELPPIGEIVKEEKAVVPKEKELKEVKEEEPKEEKKPEKKKREKPKKEDESKPWSDLLD